jgi:hypothetical protein
VAGVMMGRAAYHCPWMFRKADTVMFKAGRDGGWSRREVVERYLDYSERMICRHKVREGGTEGGGEGGRGWGVVWRWLGVWVVLDCGGGREGGRAGGREGGREGGR